MRGMTGYPNGHFDIISVIPYRVLVFLFFLCGCLMQQIGKPAALSPLLHALSTPLLLLIPLSAALLMGSSFLGPALLPVCVFLSGQMMGDCVQRLLPLWASEPQLGIRQLLALLLFMPSMFITAEMGLELSRHTAASGSFRRKALYRQYTVLSAAVILILVILFRLMI